MNVKVLEDTKVLVPNPEHRNFTEGNDVIQQDTLITGEPKVIAGLRRGEPFEYRLFLTNDNKLIYLNKVRNMDATEIKLGADSTGTVGPTRINLKQTTLARPAIIGIIGGAALGFGWAKYKKHDMKKAGMYALVGALAGFVIGKVIAHTGTVTPGK